MPDGPQFELGWEEWLALPDLGLPAIKAKIDTGAKTSALHASVIEPFGPMTSPQVRFLIQPDPNNPALEVTCSAPVVDRRMHFARVTAQRSYILAFDTAGAPETMALSGGGPSRSFRSAEVDGVV